MDLVDSVRVVDDAAQHGRWGEAEAAAANARRALDQVLDGLKEIGG